MAWPQSHDYNEAVQDPTLCFADPDLQKAEAVCTALGLPQARSGNFADVYQLRAADGKTSWAVKCFTKPVRDLQTRYQQISRHLAQANLPFTVDFTYLEKGIRIHGEWYPVLKMDWVEGLTLNQFAQTYADKPKLLQMLGGVMWRKLAQRLQQAHIAHADLQHGNVLLVPGATESKLSLRLIDYDGMHVPALADKKSGELGHPAYQHPQRLREEIYSAEVDRFPHLVIYTALRCLALRGRECWERYNTGDNLLFTAQDFKAPEASALLRELWSAPEAALRALAGHIVLALQGPLDRVPQLEELLREGAVVLPSAAQERRVVQILGAAGAAPAREAMVYGVEGGLEDPPVVIPVKQAEAAKVQRRKKRLKDAERAADATEEIEEPDSEPAQQFAQLLTANTRLVLGCALAGVAMVVLGFAVFFILPSSGTPPPPPDAPVPPPAVAATTNPPTTAPVAPPVQPPAAPEELKFTGQLAAGNPKDTIGRYYRVHLLPLAAGRTYQIKMASPFTGSLLLEDGAGTLLAENFGGSLQNAQLTFTPDSPGLYRLVVGSFISGFEGDYTITMNPPPMGKIEIGSAQVAIPRIAPADSGAWSEFTATLAGFVDNGTQRPPVTRRLLALRGGDVYALEVESAFSHSLRVEAPGGELRAVQDSEPSQRRKLSYESRAQLTPPGAGRGPTQDHTLVVTSTEIRPAGPFTVRLRRLVDPVKALAARTLPIPSEFAGFLAKGPLKLDDVLTPKESVDLAGRPFKLHRVHLPGGREWMFEVSFPAHLTLLDAQGIRIDPGSTSAGPKMPGIPPPEAVNGDGTTSAQRQCAYRTTVESDVIVLITADDPSWVGPYSLKVGASLADALAVREFLTKADLARENAPKSMRDRIYKEHVFTLPARVQHIIEMQSSSLDSFLELHDDAGGVLTADNNSGGDGKNAMVTFTPKVTARYHAVATSAGGTQVGSYTILVRPSPESAGLLAEPLVNFDNFGSPIMPLGTDPNLWPLQGRWRNSARRLLLEVKGNEFALLFGGSVLYTGKIASKGFTIPLAVDLHYGKVLAVGGSVADVGKAVALQGRTAMGICEELPNNRLRLALARPGAGRPVRFDGSEPILTRDERRPGRGS